MIKGLAGTKQNSVSSVSYNVIPIPYIKWLYRENTAMHLSRLVGYGSWARNTSGMIKSSAITEQNSPSRDTYPHIIPNPYKKWLHGKNTVTRPSRLVGYEFGARYTLRITKGSAGTNQNSVNCVTYKVIPNPYIKWLYRKNTVTRPSRLVEYEFGVKNTLRITKGSAGTNQNSVNSTTYNVIPNPYIKWLYRKNAVTRPSHLVGYEFGAKNMLRITKGLAGTNQKSVNSVTYNCYAQVTQSLTPT